MSARYQALHERLAGRLQFLPDKPEETAESTLSALWHAAAGVPKSAEQALREALPELDEGAMQVLEQLVARRLEGVPLAHLTGRQRFMGMEMLAGPQALVPRKETELLAHAAVDLATLMGRDRATITVLDVCTGAGNVALAIANRLPNARVFAADLSEDAIMLARRNAEHLNLEDRVQFHCGDLLAPFDNPDFLGGVELLTCNPPYISSAKVELMAAEISIHEPHLAFDGGPFGVAILMRLLHEAPRFLRRNGWLAFEIGLGQGPALIRHVRKSGVFQEVRAIEDGAGAPRAIVARY